MIPSKNESYVETLVEQIHHTLSFSHEILVQTEDGMCNALYNGVRKAKGKYIAIMDADGSHSPKDLNLMILNLILQRDTKTICVGSRQHGFSKHQPFMRQIVSLFCSWLTRHWLNLNLQDPLSGFIVCKREYMKFEPIQGCKVALEIFTRTNPSNVLELPIVMLPRRMGKSRQKPLEGVYLLKQLWRLKRESYKQNVA